MPKAGASLKSSLRKSVIEAFRARGHGRSNLWLIYSPKTDADWILPSDRQFIHWIYFLEANPDVTDFDLAPEPIISHDVEEARATELDAIVSYRNRNKEWHEVKASSGKKSPKNRSQFQAQSAAASSEGVKYRVFDDEDLNDKVKSSIRWLKVIAYATAIRGHEHVSCRTALISYLKNQQTGAIHQLITAFPTFDIAILLGVLSRLAIQGVVNLDLTKMSFGLLTQWRYCG